MDNFDLKKHLVENKITRNSKMLKEETDWSDLDVDFSDSSEIQFKNRDTYFQVDAEQFQQDFNGFVVDTKGRKRAIDKETFDDTRESYLENWSDEDDSVSMNERH